MIAVNDLREKLLAVIDAGQHLERDMLLQYAKPYEDGRLVMDFERIEDDLRRLNGKLALALLSVSAVLALAEEDDASYWDEAAEMAA